MKRRLTKQKSKKETHMKVLTRRNKSGTYQLKLPFSRITKKTSILPPPSLSSKLPNPETPISQPGHIPSFSSNHISLTSSTMITSAASTNKCEMDEGDNFLECNESIHFSELRKKDEEIKVPPQGVMQSSLNCDLVSILLLILIELRTNSSQ